MDGYDGELWTLIDTYTYITLLSSQYLGSIRLAFIIILSEMKLK